MNFKDSWKAEWQGGALHISGVTDRFPNTFSTASLKRIGSDSEGAVAYHIQFHRDKEPFCGPDLTGAVHYFERTLPLDVRSVTISFPGDPDFVTVQVPQRR